MLCIEGAAGGAEETKERAMRHHDEESWSVLRAEFKVNGLW